MSFSVAFEKEKKIFKPVRKVLIKSTIGDKSQIPTVCDLKEEQEEDKQRTETRIVRRKHNNIFQHVYKFIPLTHIHNVFDLFGINEQTLRHPDNDESFFKTLFHLRSITCVEVSDDYVLVNLSTNSRFPNMDYLMERFNSYGDAYFHQLAQRLGGLQKYTSQFDMNLHCQTYNPQPAMEKVVEKYKGKPYFIRIFPNYFLFSKELIKMTGRTEEQFVQECIKYRALVVDLFMGQNYTTVLDQTFDYITYLYYLLSMNNPAVFQSTEIRQMDHTALLRGKNETKLFCKTKGVVSNPFVMTMVVDEVVRSEPLVPKKMITQEQKDKYNAERREEMEDLAEQVEFDLEREGKRCGYTLKPKQRRKRKREDEDYQVGRFR